MPNRMRVLVVDDSPADLMLAQVALETHADRVRLTTAPDGEAALAHLRDPEQPLPDLILLDINMPGLTGLQVLSSIRHDPALCHLPVGILSTSESQTNILDAYDRQASFYIVKAPHLSELMQMFERLIAFWSLTPRLPNW
ncbi:response regulator [Deinococcus sp. HMF7604]|uniref:response regulator n=1 Tax=Deinococcus betulae TaxID=2873312 RepID=UPI001CCBC85A|nr:response regulator [Deinococcus betulae]MBZ9750177.1 response regulator [Deinococcus betulae]